MKKEEMNQDLNNSSEKRMDFKRRFRNTFNGFKQKLDKNNKKKKGKYGHNLFKNIFMYIFIAIVVAYINLDIIGDAMQSGIMQYSYALEKLTQILMFALPVIAALMYTPKDLKDRIIAKKNNELFKYFLAKTLRLFQVGMTITALTMLGKLILNMFLDVNVGVGIIPIIGIIVVNIILSLVIILINEMILLTKKSSYIAIVLSMIAAIFVTTATFNFADVEKTTMFDPYRLDFAQIFPVLMNGIFIAFLLVMGFLVTKLDEREYSVGKRARIFWKLALISYILVVITGYSIVTSMHRKGDLDIYMGVIDNTSSKEYTLSDNLKDALRKLDKKVNIRYLFSDSVVDRRLEILGKEAEKITDKIDFSDAQKLTEGYKVSNVSSVLNNKVWIDLEDSEIVAPFVIDYLSDAEIMKDYENGITYSLLDSLIVKGLNAVNIEDKYKKVMILDLYEKEEEQYRMESNVSNLASIIGKTGKSVSFLNLSDKKKLNEQGTVIIGATPRDINEKELDMLKEYAQSGGNLIILKAPVEKKYKISYPNLNKLINEYGINIDDNKTVYDLDPRRRTPVLVELTEEEKKKNAENSIYEGVKYKYLNEVILPDINIGAVSTKAMQISLGNYAPVTTYNGVIDILDNKDKKNIDIKKIFTTSNQAVAVDDPKIEHMRADKIDGKKGEYILAAEVTKNVKDDKKSKLLAVSSYNIFTDQVTKTSESILGTTNYPLVLKQETVDFIKGMVDFVQPSYVSLNPVEKENQVFRLDAENPIIKENPESAKESIVLSARNGETGKLGILDKAVLIYAGIILLIGIIVTAFKAFGSTSKYEELEKSVK